MSPSAPSASMQAVESRLLEENPLWLAIITSAAADIDAPVGSGGDHWRALDATTSASAGAVKTHFLSHVYTKSEQFTKPGSGQI